MHMPLHRALLITVACGSLAACENGFDFDLRDLGNGFDTSQAVAQATAPRPQPDARGVLSYPNYQVAVARQGDKIGDVAARVGLPAAELARYNGINPDTPLRKGEVIALPGRVSEPSPQTGAIGTGAIQPAGSIDVTTLADDAINRADSGGSAISAPASASSGSTVTAQSGAEPQKHRVAAGETAYSIARKYNVTVKALAEWNGLGTGLNLREGQFLLIPPAAEAPAPKASAAPGTGSVTPVPPSAAAPLPKNAAPAATATPKPVSPANSGQTAASAARFALPVPGPIVRDYDKAKSSFVLFQAAPGTPVKAADNGTVKLVSKNADGVEIIVVDHGGGIQTAYSFVEGITVQKGASVSRGQTIAKVAKNEFNALQFMTFKGTQTVDPTPYLK